MVHVTCVRLARAKVGVETRPDRTTNSATHSYSVCSPFRASSILKPDHHRTQTTASPRHPCINRPLQLSLEVDATLLVAHRVHPRRSWHPLSSHPNTCDCTVFFRGRSLPLPALQMYQEEATMGATTGTSQLMAFAMNSSTLRGPNQWMTRRKRRSRQVSISAVISVHEPKSRLTNTPCRSSDQAKLP